MSEPFTRIRRILLAGAALAVSAWILRSPMADALVTRGDDYLYGGDRYQAFVHYRRSYALNPDSEIAADRLAFIATLQRSHSGMQSGIDAADAYLRRHPNDSKLLADRGLCNLKLHRYDAAFRDFYRAAEFSGDPQTFTFAGWAAERAGHALLALQMWRRALHSAPHYRPAIFALRERSK